MRRTRKSTDELERIGEGDLEFAGVDVVEGISPPSPSLSTTESSIKILFFLSDSGTDSELVQEKNEKGEEALTCTRVETRTDAEDEAGYKWGDSFQPRLRTDRRCSKRQAMTDRKSRRNDRRLTPIEAPIQDETNILTTAEE